MKSKPQPTLHINLTIGVLALTVTQLYSQFNMVPNPSFEYYIECPRDFSAVEPAGSNYPSIRDWVRPTVGSSDYYHACASEASLLNVPNNFAGHIEAKDGLGYCGIFVFSGNDTLMNIEDYREYLQVRLLSPMVAGNDYCVGFYVRPAGYNSSSNEQVFYATHRLGAHLSTSAIEAFSKPGVGEVLPYTPQVVASGMVSDTSQWTRIVGTYTATGGEQWITIGNFFKDSLTHPLVLLWGDKGTLRYHDSYYFVDQVSVYEVEHARTFATSGEYPVCDAFPLEISATAGMETYLWNTGETTRTITVSAGGQFWVAASFAGCPIRDTVEVVAYAPPVVDLGVDIDLCSSGKESPIWLHNTTQLSNYAWTFGVTLDSFLVTYPGLYQLSTNHPCGMFSDEIEVFGCTSAIYIPNIITPQSNDLNAVFLPSGLHIEILSLEVYDVWGHRVFRSLQPSSGWNGTTTDGRYVNPGVFMYRLKYQNTLTGETLEKIGDLTVIR